MAKGTPPSATAGLVKLSPCCHSPNLKTPAGCPTPPAHPSAPCTLTVGPTGSPGPGSKVPSTKDKSGEGQRAGTDLTTLEPGKGMSHFGLASLTPTGWVGLQLCYPGFPTLRLLNPWPPFSSLLTIDQRSLGFCTGPELSPFTLGRWGKITTRPTSSTGQCREPVSVDMPGPPQMVASDLGPVPSQ